MSPDHTPRPPIRVRVSRPAEEPAPPLDVEQPVSQPGPEQAAGAEAAPEQPAPAEAGPEAPGPRASSPAQRAAVVLAFVALTSVAVLVWFLLKGQGGPALVVEGGRAQAGLQPLLAISGPGVEPYPEFARPLGAAFGRDGRLYVCDTDHDRVVYFTAEGEYLGEFGGQGIAKPLPGGEMTWDPGELNTPVGIDVDDRGDVYVADFQNDSISVFSADGDFLRRFPEPSAIVGKGGSGLYGRGIAVTDVAVRGDLVYATDAYQVVVFKRDGTFVRQFGKPGRGPEDLDRPNGIAVAADGTIYVSDTNNNRVVAFTPAGKQLWSAGRPISELTREVDNPFNLPRGLDVMDDGSILVADALDMSLVHLAPNGKVIARFGVRGDEPGQLSFPNDVSVSGDLVLVADRENDRVQVMRLVGR